jgi:hypothetical protein
MAVYQFADADQNIITYNFDPELRDENGDGPVALERISRKAEPQDASILLYPEPKMGDEFYWYRAEAGGDVRYQYDPGSRNGKDYVVAIHRTPENWKRLVEENFGVKGMKQRSTGAGKREHVDENMKSETPEEKRRDSGIHVG